jgi:hypothetical protein
MTTIHRLTVSTVLRAELRNARYFQMSAYRGNLEGKLRADAPYFPRRIDALGLYRIAGSLTHPDGNLLDGFYAVDDFGQLVRIPFGTVMALLQ